MIYSTSSNLIENKKMYSMCFVLTLYLSILKKVLNDLTPSEHNVLPSRPDHRLNKQFNNFKQQGCIFLLKFNFFLFPKFFRWILFPIENFKRVTLSLSFLSFFFPIFLLLPFSPFFSLLFDFWFLPPPWGGSKSKIILPC